MLSAFVEFASFGDAVATLSPDAELAPARLGMKNWRRVLLGFDLSFAFALSAFEAPLFLLRGLALLFVLLLRVFLLSCLSSWENLDCSFCLSFLLFARLGCASSFSAHCTWFVSLRTRPKEDEDFAKKNEI